MLNSAQLVKHMQEKGLSLKLQLLKTHDIC